MELIERAKKRTNEGRLYQCIREFKLPQQFPSMVISPKKNVTWENKNVTNTLQACKLTSTAPKYVKIIPNKKSLVECNVQKLRIMSPGGKDLGEFDMKLCTDQENLLKREINRNNFKYNKSVTLSPASNSSKEVSQTIKQNSTYEAKNYKSAKLQWIKILKAVDKIAFQTKSNENNMFQRRIHNESVIKTTLKPNQNPKISKEMQVHKNNIDESKVLISMNEENVKQTIKNQKEQIYEVEHKSAISTIDNEHLIYDLNNPLKFIKSSMPTQNKSNTSSVSNITNKELVSTAKQIYNNIAASRFPIVSCKKLDAAILENLSKRCKQKCIATIKNTENGKIVTSLQSISDSTVTYKQAREDASKKNIYNSTTALNRQIVPRHKDNLSQNTPESVYQNNQMYEMKTQPNIMTIIPNDKTPLFNKNANFTQECNGIISTNHKNDIKINDKNKKDTIYHNDKQNKIASNKEVKNNDESLRDYACYVSDLGQIADIIGVDMQSNMQNKVCSKDSSHEDLSEQWNIIEKAMSSVQDENLRIQALKALSDCGIGMERYVPVYPPEKFKAIHDSQIQTTIFGLLHPQSFILMDKDENNIQRLEPITVQDTVVEDHLHPVNNYCSTYNGIESEIDFDIDSFFNQICNENSNALQVKETLSTNMKYKRILEQLQTDFKSAKQYDENGMLNIHKAVIKNNIYDIQRYLMILKQCKEDVDILTEDGMTSLELAIKYEACSEIVKILLKAGAQPILPKLTHESAVIIASKQNSSMLSMLISYVSDKKLLDQVDSEGLAALHYCCIYGNLNGVDALLSAGATIDLKDKKSGRTSLFHAIENNNKAITERLIETGAIASTMNYAGQTPLPIINDSITIQSFKIKKNQFNLCNDKE